MERYDIGNDSWETLNPLMKTARLGFGAAVLNGKIYVCGGHTGNEFLKSVEVYDPISQRYFHNIFM